MNKKKWLLLLCAIVIIVPLTVKLLTRNHSHSTAKVPFFTSDSTVKFYGLYMGVPKAEAPEEIRKGMAEASKTLMKVLQTSDISDNVEITGPNGVSCFSMDDKTHRYEYTPSMECWHLLTMFNMGVQFARTPQLLPVSDDRWI